MHSHSTESDGDKTVQELVEEAREHGIAVLWITDHDLIRTSEKNRALIELGRSRGVAVSLGVEITVGWEKKEHHLLGYFPDTVWNSKMSKAMLALQKGVKEVKDSRERRNDNLVSFLNQVLRAQAGATYFITPEAFQKMKSRSVISVDEVTTWAMHHASLAEATSLGRPHFNAFLSKVCGVRKELIFGPRSGDGRASITADGKVLWDEERKEATGPTQEVEALMHTAVLGRRKIVFEPMPIVEAIQQIHASGGRAVLAHPPTLGADWATKFGPKIKALAEAGMWGLEAWSSEVSENNHQELLRLAKENGLVATGGSDNHGTLKPYAQLGRVHRATEEPYGDVKSWVTEAKKVKALVQADFEP